MFDRRFCFRLLAVSALAAVVSGCSVTNYRTSDYNPGLESLSAAARYQVTGAETVIIRCDDDGQIPAVKLDLLTRSLKNRPGTVFAPAWRNAVAAIGKAGYLDFRFDDTTAFRIDARCVNPLLFDDAAGSVPVQIRTVIAYGPATYSAWWTTTYVLSLSMSPMRKYSFGAMVVSVLDREGKTLCSQAVAFQYSTMFSGLFPTALFGAEGISRSSAFFRHYDENETALRTEVMVRTAAGALCAKPAPAAPEWLNVRDAVLEALASGNEDAAVRLLKSVRKRNLGGAELEGYLNVMGL